VNTKKIKQPGIVISGSRIIPEEHPWDDCENNNVCQEMIAMGIQPECHGCRNDPDARIFEKDVELDVIE
jgi:hypothetical protein